MASLYKIATGVSPRGGVFKGMSQQGLRCHIKTTLKEMSNLKKDTFPPLQGNINIHSKYLTIIKEAPFNLKG